MAIPGWAFAMSWSLKHETRAITRRPRSWAKRTARAYERIGGFCVAPASTASGTLDG